MSAIENDIFVVDIVASPVSSGAKLEAEPAQESIAAPYTVSVFPREQKLIGALLSNAAGGPSVLYRALQAVLWAKVLLTLATKANSRALGARMVAPNDLLHVSAALDGVSSVMYLLALSSARIALMPIGALGQLNAGVQIARCEKWLKEGQAGGLERLEAREG
jgi:hypothetical protein